MKTQVTVEIVNPHSGGVVLRADDDNYVLAQQIDAKPLRPAQILTGSLDLVGVETMADLATGITYDFFIEAYGLSRAAALESLH